MPGFINSNDTANMHNAGISEFGAFELSGFRLEDIAELSRNPLFYPKISGQDITSDPLEFGLNSTPVSTDTTLTAVSNQHRAHQPNIASLSSGNFENWSESAMTDTSADIDTDEKNQQFDGQLVPRTASDSSDRSKEKTSDQKTLRRLAQNREAARKSRLRKKAYVQQLESSKLKLAQLEHELQRARQQGISISNSGEQSHSMSRNGALAFDMEYARWQEDQNRQINELRSAVNSHASENDLRVLVDNIMVHYSEIFKLKSTGVKADVFHMLSGMWKTPVERCFLWLGGFRSSELLKLLANQLEPLTEQQLVGIYNLQQSSQQAEDALSQGMEALHQSLAETLASGSSSSNSSGNVATYMGQMAMAMGKLGTLETFLCQADKLRQQTLQQMHRILTTRQSARALLAIHDYFSRLRALSSLWLARPKELGST